MIKSILLLITLVVTACSGCRHTLPDAYKGRQVTVGSGGRFTGQTTTYFLLDNGRLFRKTSRDTMYTALGKLNVTRRKQFFSALLDTCQIKTNPYDQPGNVSRFILFQNGNETYRVTWTAGDTSVQASYPRFYQSFMNMLPAPYQRNKRQL